MSFVFVLAMQYSWVEIKVNSTFVVARLSIHFVKVKE